MEKQVKFSVFKCLNGIESKPVGIDEIIRLIKYDESVRKKTELFREMAVNVSRKVAKQEVKEKAMPAFSVGVLFNGSGRQSKDISHATGFALCDFDKTPSDSPCLGGGHEGVDIRGLICQDPHTFLCYQTISGEGFRVIYRFVREGDVHLNCEAYPAAFRKGNEYYKALTGYDYDHGCSDAVRLSGLAHDAEVYFYPDSEPFVITDDEMVVETEETVKEPGKPRRVYDAHTQHATPIEAFPKVQRMMEQRGYCYAPHHHHDYIVHAAYLFNRFGCEEETLKEWAQQEWSEVPQKERDSVIMHCFKKTAEHGTWRLQQKDTKGRRNALLSTTEIRAWLSERCKVMYNVVTDQTVYKRLSGNGEDYELITDRVVESMRCQMEADTGKRVLTKDVLSVLNSDFSILFHPIRDYIDQLPGWDGKDRVQDLARHVTATPVVLKQCQEEIQEDFLWALHKWLIAMVATWMDDRQANHQVLTIIGEQGIYKTTFFRHLLPPALRPYFWENAHNSFSQKDDKLAIAENCLVEIEEIEAIEGKYMSELKALVTAETINERRVYARYRMQKARLASFCATGNEQQFLTDSSGNRRWLCFRVSHIDDPRTWGIDYDQLYAQLRDEYLKGFQFWFDKEEEQRVERLNQPFHIISIEEQLISHRLRKPRIGESSKLMSSTMISVLIGGGHLSHQISVRKIGVIMRKLGFKWKHRMDGDYYRVVEIPYNEIQSYLSDKEELTMSF